MWVEFFVPGKAKAQGSLNPFINKHTGKIVVVQNQKVKDWRSRVGIHASTQAGISVVGKDTPVVVRVTFRIQRPKTHYRTGKFSNELRSDAPMYPTSHSTGDVDKHLRSILDALTGIAYHDDSQVIESFAQKRYAEDRCPEGATITVSTIEIGEQQNV